LVCKGPYLVYSWFVQDAIETQFKVSMASPGTRAVRLMAAILLVSAFLAASLCQVQKSALAMACQMQAARGSVSADGFDQNHQTECLEGLLTTSP
jgi:hypothetical protein